MSIMDDITEYAARGPRRSKDHCRAPEAAKAAKIPLEDFEHLVNAVRDGSLSVTNGHRILLKHNASLSYSTLYRHVNDECTCRTAKDKA